MRIKTEVFRKLDRDGVQIESSERVVRSREPSVFFNHFSIF